MSRRRFVRLATLGGYAALSSFLGRSIPGRQKRGNTSYRTAAAEGNMTSVAFVKTEKRDEGVARAVELLEMDSFAGKSVFLKPNFNSADVPPGSTHNATLRALVNKLWEMGVSRITVGDRSGMGNTRRVMETKGIFEMGKELGFEVVVLEELDRDGWVKIEAPDTHWSQGFYLPRMCLEADAIVQTCCLKTHRFGGHFTISLKNSVGLGARTVPGDSHDYMRELHTSPYQRLMIGEINAFYQPALIVMDGVEAFTDGGPDRGTRVKSNLVAAGYDRVAVDAVGVAALRYFGTTPEVSQGTIFQQEQIARAVELGVGIASPESITIIPADESSKAYADQIAAILMA
ncbi:MAG: DUF362 domain-containing protein [Chloroflexi bacterium]|nr:DUF362 domain-containing protein [Chloroflexota bacterium]